MQIKCDRCGAVAEAVTPETHQDGDIEYTIFRCPDCGAEHRIFGPSRAGELASRHDIAAVASLPIDPEYAKAVDLGAVEKLDAPSLDVILDAVLAH